MASREIQYVKSIGEKRAELFKKLGIDTAYALLRFYPRAYKDFKNTVKLFDAIPETVVAVKCRIVSKIHHYKTKNNLEIYSFSAADDSGLLQVKIFNNKYAAEGLKEGKTYIFYGKISGNFSDRQMTSPEIIEPDKAGIIPVYNLTAGLKQGNIRNAVKAAMEFMPPELIPDIIRRKYALCDINFAIRNIHFPTDYESLEAARKRLVFEELFLFRMGVSIMRSSNKIRNGMSLNSFYFEEFKNLLPFTLTDSQNKVVLECFEDMKTGRQMNRLVQGDVGSGKTAVAAAVMHTAAKNGMQCVMMAPTEILAEQHLKTILGFLGNTGLKIELLTSSVKKSQKQKIKEALKSGEINIVIGTQALIQDDVEFYNLGLVVTDEQHRFGVNQRGKLASKGASPHILVMSATPIPRTLALILYGDLDISTINVLPKGRKPISTYAVGKGYRPRIHNFIKKNITDGRQAYIVCPLVEEGENDNDMKAAESYFEELKNGAFKGYNVGLLHGKQKPQEKETVMRAFKDGEIQLLVATTVIEVGVDVPNATVMVIENAERFGLSQLHQLRGRVGRGEHESHCILVSDSKGEETKLRLNTMCKTTDGFKISEQDLKLRGPGDFMGNRQHGLPDFRMADLSCDMRELEAAGKAAAYVIDKDPNLSAPENMALREEIKELFFKKRNEMN